MGDIKGGQLGLPVSTCVSEVTLPYKLLNPKKRVKTREEESTAKQSGVGGL